MWLLGTELRTFGRAVSALNLWAISPALEESYEVSIAEQSLVISYVEQSDVVSDVELYHVVWYAEKSQVVSDVEQML